MPFELLAQVGKGPFPQLFHDGERVEKVMFLNAAGLVKAGLSEDLDEVMVYAITDKGRKALAPNAAPQPR
jgi:hypothetical protein